MSKVTLGLLQHACGADPKANLKKTLALTEQAAKKGAKIICTQELFRSQYFCQSEDHAHFDLAEEKPVETVRSALNFHLKPRPVAVVLAEQVTAEFHARFSATWRRYRYRILNRRAPPALDRGQLWHVGAGLDAAAMAEAASVLVGHHDFNSFRSTACQAPSALKTLDLFEVSRDGDEIRVDVGSRSFLHNQVRILVGTLGLVGRGQWTRRDVEDALAARDRTRAGPTAPPQGLCLMEVRYGLADAGGDAEEAVDDQ